MIEQFFANVNRGDFTSILLLISDILLVIMGIVEVWRTKNFSVLKKGVENLKEDLKSVKAPEEKKPAVIKITHKLPGVFFGAKSQKFSPYMPEYKLDEKTNELVATGGVIDVQEQVQSYVDTCLEKALDKYLTNETLCYSSEDLPDEAFGVREPLNDKVGYAMEARNYFEDIREKFGLPDDMTDENIVQTLKTMADDNAQKIKKSQEAKNVQEVKKDDNQINVDEAIAFYKEHHKEGM